MQVSQSMKQKSFTGVLALNAKKNRGDNSPENAEFISDHQPINKQKRISIRCSTQVLGETNVIYQPPYFSRQPIYSAEQKASSSQALFPDAYHQLAANGQPLLAGSIPVSYTHLTLPTILLV